MTALSRRCLLVSAIAGLLATPSLAGNAGWIEVVGMAHARNAADIDSARRRALADALLSAALAGGAEVRGHTAVRNTRVTSDMLLVRPVGQVLEHRVLSATFDGAAWTVRIRARVGPPATGSCTARRRLVLAAEAPVVEVPLTAPAWAAALAPELAEGLVTAAAKAPSVVRLVRLPSQPDPSGNRSGQRYAAATRPAVTFPAAAHLLTIGLRIAPVGNDLRLEARMTLASPSGELLRILHVASVPRPRASPLGRTAVLAEPGRARMEQRLSAGLEPALLGLIATAACQPVRARLRLASGRLVADAGRENGLVPTSLAFTADLEGPSGALEIAELGDHQSYLQPIDPGIPPAALAGRVVRFVDVGAGL